jgi:hypothetical protein
MSVTVPVHALVQIKSSLYTSVRISGLPASMLATIIIHIHIGSLRYFIRVI